MFTWIFSSIRDFLWREVHVFSMGKKKNYSEMHIDRSLGFYSLTLILLLWILSAGDRQEAYNSFLRPPDIRWQRLLPPAAERAHREENLGHQRPHRPQSVSNTLAPQNNMWRHQIISNILFFWSMSSQLYVTWVACLKWQS